jgi:23S rRNA (uracil1939-C5)-methyltransferase
VSEILELEFERPVAGGRMLARHEGKIVFVAGAIPGERVRARIERTSKQSVFAAVTDVISASPDRRHPPCDPACGGSTFAHIQYDRQRALKRDILIDAFHRLAKIELPPALSVAASPEQGYRLRARLHPGLGGVGYFLEGTHTVCDAASTGQVSADAVGAAARVVSALGPLAHSCAAALVSENVAATARVIHLEPAEGVRFDEAATALAAAADAAGPIVTGVTILGRGGVRLLHGSPYVVDSADELFRGDVPFAAAATWTRSALPFFQANRYLVGALVRQVLQGVAGADRVVDLYAGVGLFSVAMAAAGARVFAVEGDRRAADDLEMNASPFDDRLEVAATSVEEVAMQRPRDQPDVLVLDPPRSGASAKTIEGIAAWRVPKIVYVSCDPPTLARDAARLLVRGYQLETFDAFDMFPNTPHVEAVATFGRG